MFRMVTKNDFFRDCLRVLRPGGVMWHAVDLYLPDAEERRRAPAYIEQCYQILLKLLDMGEWIAEPEYTGELYSRARYASNPDLTLHSWNKIVPKLKEVRARSQSCSLLIGMRKRMTA